MVGKPGKEAFLEALARTGEVTDACRIVGIARNTVYQQAKRSSKFAEAFERAREEGEKALLDLLRGHIKYRAIAQRNDGMTYFLTKRLDPRFRDNAPAVNIHTSGPTGIKIIMDEGELPKQTALDPKG